MPRVNYEVIGGKQAGKSGRILSRHTTLDNAKRSARKHAKKGYSGAIYKIMPLKKESKVQRYILKEEKQKNKTWRSSWISFGPEKGVVSHRTKKRRS